MSLVKCPTCGAKISRNAAACPKCGEPITQEVVLAATAAQEIDDRIAGRTGLFASLFLLFLVGSCALITFNAEPSPEGQECYRNSIINGTLNTELYKLCMDRVYPR